MLTFNFSSLGDLDRIVFITPDTFLNLYILPVASWLRSKSSHSKCRGTCVYNPEEETMLGLKD